MNAGQLKGEALDAVLAEADGLVDFPFSAEILKKAPKLQIAASGGVGFEHHHVKRDSLDGECARALHCRVSYTHPLIHQSLGQASL